MNGYNYNGGYDASGMNQNGQYGGSDTMMMGQDQVGNGMMGGQSLDEIVNQNAKAIRRQSMPPQNGANINGMSDADMRGMYVMNYGGTSPAGSMGNFGFDANAGMDRNAMMTGTSPAHSTQYQQRPSQSDHGSRRQSNDNLALNTNFAGNGQGYNGMMHPNSAFASPAHPQSGMDMGMNSPYVDPNPGMSMDALSNQMGDNAMNMNLYNQPQFNNPMVSSPMHASAGHATPGSATAGPLQDPSGGNGMNAQFGHHGGSHSGGSTVRALSRSQSLQAPDASSPGQAGTPMSQGGSGGGGSTSQPQQPPHQASNAGFRGQPQYPQPGSKQDRGMGNSNFNGVNGPLPVNPAKYNPNNQGFNWETPEGGWPSTLNARPHMQSSYKNAYSSTGFDMLGVLVCVSLLFNTVPYAKLIQHPDARCNPPEPRNQYRLGRPLLRLRSMRRRERRHPHRLLL